MKRKTVTLITVHGGPIESVTYLPQPENSSNANATFPPGLRFERPVINTAGYNNYRFYAPCDYGLAVSLHQRQQQLAYASCGIVFSGKTCAVTANSSAKADSASVALSV